MTKTIKVPNGLLTLNESKAICPYCERKIGFDEIEDKFMKSKDHYIKFKDKCKRFIGITQDIRGDFRAFELKKHKVKVDKKEHFYTSQDVEALKNLENR